MQEKLYCFADKAGSYAPCNCICVALVCFQAHSMYQAARGVLAELYSMLGWRRGELKWRSVRRAAERRGLDRESIVRVVVERSSFAAWRCSHLTSTLVLHTVKERLLSLLLGMITGGKVYLVVDEGLVRGDSVLGVFRTKLWAPPRAVRLE